METNMLILTTPSSDTRQGRSERRAIPRKRDFASEAPTAPLSDACPLSPHRRAKSLDRRSTESSMTPDLLNFKKGWLTKQYEDGQWKKHWFVLADQSLRYYRDSVAEEAADLDGEINLSTCYDVTEYPVQRNYGFQIHTKEGEFTLSAMTSGIRRNWIQTIMKHVLQATCERGFAAMEETHQKKIEDLQRQHQRELEKLREEKDRLLAEETAATISAIEAMKNAHREEMERELEKSQRSQISSINSDIEALRRQYLEELQSVQRELEVLSEQYSQKCLENAHLAQALEAERQALRQCQRENQELNAHNQELNNRLAAEITRLRTLLTGDGGGESTGLPLTQGKDAYELEVLLRVKESEIQYLKQEISSLKDELQTALRDKKYASDKYKDIYTELSIAKAKADCDISRLKEQLKAATEALGEKSPEGTTVSGYDIMKSKSNPDFLKKDRSCVTRQLRNIRSKSLKEGLTVQERLKLFESRDLKKD